MMALVYITTSNLKCITTSLESLQLPPSSKNDISVHIYIAEHLVVLHADTPTTDPEVPTNTFTSPQLPNTSTKTTITITPPPPPHTTADTLHILHTHNLYYPSDLLTHPLPIRTVKHTNHPKLPKDKTHSQPHTYPRRHNTPYSRPLEPSTTRPRRNRRYIKLPQ
eukprot:gene1164-2259_t